MKTIASVPIDKPIAVFGSGPSVLNMGSDEIQSIHERCFVVMMNYAMSRFGSLEMDVLAFHDSDVAFWLADGHLKPNVMLWATEVAFPFGQPDVVKDKVDFWLHSSKGNFTLTNILHDLRRFHPDKQILLFGVDFKVPEGDDQKWYDKFTDNDKRRRKVEGTDHTRCFAAQERELKLVDAGDKIWNCNLDSALAVFPIVDWMEVLGP